jgi:hypothetical protein
MIPNQGPMSNFIGPFDVQSCLADSAYHVQFSHLWNGIATRHSDTIDNKFFVDGRGVVVGLAHQAFAQFHDQTGRNLTDREASFIAAEYLRGRLEQEDERPIYDVSADEVLQLIERLAIR